MCELPSQWALGFLGGALHRKPGRVLGRGSLEGHRWGSLEAGSPERRPRQDLRGKIRKNGLHLPELACICRLNTFLLFWSWGLGFEAKHLAAEEREPCFLQRASQDHFSGLRGWGRAAGRSLKGAGPARRAPPSRAGRRLKLAQSKDPRESRARLLPAPAWKSQINQTPHLT